jgi:NAD(P)-dependent dehydrogenase (short-subunit alcohol dehydrogenase family)
MPARLTTPKLDVLAAVTRAIHLRQALQIRYHSISSGQSEREVVPFALLDTGLRWHVRAYDRKSAEFRDFVLTRIHEPTAAVERPPLRHELPEHDAQWTRIVDLQLVPHPDKPHPEVTCMDYGIGSGSLNLSVRAAIAGYVLRRWSVDCSPNHALSGPEHRLWLRDHLALYGVKSAAIAPGYQLSPLGAKSDG